nr:MAG TPA: hypothetical protein [Caudoviricetes sp.]DAV80992.1 MAG TPA: hypothetical protein [Caudoviricetes sp.]
MRCSVAGSGRSGRWRHHRHNKIIAVCSLCPSHRWAPFLHKRQGHHRATGSFPNPPGRYGNGPPTHSRSAGALFCCVWRSSTGGGSRLTEG